MHYVELDQFIGGRYLVTVHGPVNPAIDPSTAMVEVNAVLGRLESEKLQPGTALESSFALLAALTARMRAYTAELTKDVWKLEQQVTIEAFGAGKGQDLLLDAVDQFQHLTVMAKGQKDYLQGTIEFYQARTNTIMTIASVAAILLVMLAMSGALLVWAKRKAGSDACNLRSSGSGGLGGRAVPGVGEDA